MAILQVLGTDKALRLNDYQLLNLVNSFDWAPNFNAQDVFEMGTTSKIDTSMELETSGSFELGSVGNTSGLLARMKPKSTGGAFAGYTYDSGGASGKNGYTFTQDDLADLRFDVLMHEKPDQKTFSRSLWLPSAYLTTFSGRADANGVASETYNFAGSFVVGFNNPFHDVRSIPAKFVSVAGTSTKTSTLQLVDVGNANANLTAVSSTTHTAAYAIVDGLVISNKVGDATAVSLGTTGQVTITSTEGFVVSAGSQVTVLVYKTTSPSTVFPTATTAQRFQDGSAKPINYIKGYQANIYLAPVDGMAPAASDQWLKVQSIDYTVDLKVETLRQIAKNTKGTSIYCRVPTFPIDISANVSVTESDWADWKAILTNKSFTGTEVSDNAFEFSPEYLKPQFAVVIEYFTKSGTKVQTTRFLDMRIDGYGSRQSVGGRGEVSWTLKGTQYRVEGVNP